MEGFQRKSPFSLPTEGLFSGGEMGFGFYSFFAFYPVCFPQTWSESFASAALHSDGYWCSKSQIKRGFVPFAVAAAATAVQTEGFFPGLTLRKR